LEDGFGAEFFKYVSDDVDWTVEGTHPLAGHYRSKVNFIARNDPVMEHNELNAKENRYEKVCFSTTDYRCCHIRSNASTAEAEV
jgi:ketosteroid isomerase-like protein